MKRLSRAVTVLVMTFMLIASFAPMANAVITTIAIPANQVWTSGYGAPRSLEYSYAGARCIAVYPLQGIDNFRKIQCALFTRNSVNIGFASYYVLTEGATVYTPVKIKEGYLDETVTLFKFRGNSNSAAEARVDYTGSYNFG